MDVPSRTNRPAGSEPILSAYARFGAPPPPLPPFVQAAMFAAQYDKKSNAGQPVGGVLSSGEQVSPHKLPDKCTSPAPEQPPLVRWAVEEARSARKASTASLPRPGATPATGLLTSWEQEAELLRSMHLASHAGGSSSGASAAPSAAAAAGQRFPTVSFAPTASYSTMPAAYGLQSPSLAPGGQPMQMASSPEPRLADVRKIVSDLDNLFSAKR